MKIFLDSSVIMAALLSDIGGSSKIIYICEIGIIEGYISSSVVDEVRNALRQKFPGDEILFDQLLKRKFIHVKKMKKSNLFKKASSWIRDPDDIKILIAAKQIKVDYLITLDINDFIRDPNVAKKSGLIITTPGDFLKNAVFGI